MVLENARTLYRLQCKEGTCNFEVHVPDMDPPSASVRKWSGRSTLVPGDARGLPKGSAAARNGQGGAVFAYTRSVYIPLNGPVDS